jgi:ATP-binding cassette subfamily B protein
MNDFPIIKQLDSMDCGPACLRMIAKYYGKSYSAKFLSDRISISKGGTSMLGLSDAAENIGFKTLGIRLESEQFYNETPLPCIVHWGQNHFVVVYKIDKKNSLLRYNRKVNVKVYIADPANGRKIYSTDEFQKAWLSTVRNGKEIGHCLVLEPNSEFYKKEDEPINYSSIFDLVGYLRPFKKLIIQLVLCFVASSLLQVLLPFLSQSLVDKGINYKDLNFLTIVLIAQLALTLGQTSVSFIQSWIMLHLTTRVDISLIANFLSRLMRMPLSFFDSKNAGDIMQRIGDNSRIQNFLTSTSISIVFAIGNFIVFSFIMLYYNISIFLIFLSGSTVYILWIKLFLKYRRELDNSKFAQSSGNQSNMIELINGMQEIKLNNCEKQKRWQWESIQVKIFKISAKSLILGQYQQGGALLINSTKNFVIVYFTASAVIHGTLTLGMLFSIQYIIGQLNSPIEQFISFIQSWQDAKISLERLGEIKNQETENEYDDNVIYSLPNKKDIFIKDLTYYYDGPNSPTVLNNVNLVIPEKKVTAVVGVSGSGKTTLLKMLLGFYKPIKGDITIGDVPLHQIDCKVWRQNTGSVMQESFIFTDTIANNIAISDEAIDKKKLYHAVFMANIKDFIETLPMRYNTIIGSAGHGLSQGQKQRLLIARAIYKDPQYIFFDEATNALDSNNEKVIMDNLKEFFTGKTVVVVAHRLSTVKNADNIVVMDKGRIIEQGTHVELNNLKGEYFNLVKNQLELGS